MPKRKKEELNYVPFTGSIKQFEHRDQKARTPETVYNQLNEEFKFDFDPCPADPKFDGLEIEWGQRNYVNPPYNDVPSWIKKAYEESQKGKLVVMLLPVRTQTLWFYNYGRYAKEIRFIQGGIRFQGYNHKCPFPLMILIY